MSTDSILHVTKMTDKEPTKQETDIIKDLNKKRGYVKGRLTIFRKYMDMFDDNEAIPENVKTEIKYRLESARPLYSEYENIQSQIQDIKSDADIEQQLQDREKFELDYFSVLAKAHNLTKDEKVTENRSKSNCHHEHTSMKLPTISLPNFDGSYEHWLEFRETFLSLIHNNANIDNFSKLHYLKRSLAGDAKTVISSLELSGDNYTIAWELLLNRYNNSRLLVHTHVRSLFSLQTLTKESPDMIRKFIDSILKNIRSLKLLGEPTGTWDTLIIYMAVAKLDSTTEREWEQHNGTLRSRSGESKSTLKLDDLLTFLRDRADMLETLNLNHSKVNSSDTHESTSNQNSSQSKQKSNNTNKIHCNVASDKTVSQTYSDKKGRPNKSPKKPCLSCKDKNHPLYSCQTFLDYTLQDKLKLIRANKLCENCLRTDAHEAKDCWFGPCRWCLKKHNSLIHPDTASAGNKVNNRAVTLLSVDKDQNTHTPAASVSCGSHPDSNSHDSLGELQSYTITHTKKDVQCAHSSSVRPVLLSTAIVEVPSRTGMYHKARAILDSGSERSFITQSLCDKINANTLQSTHSIHGVGGLVTKSSQSCDIEIKSCTSTFSTRTKCMVLPNITNALPSITMQRSDFIIPNNVQLADPTFHESLPIDLLLGVDVFWDLLIVGRMRLANGPYLQNTKLGWVISGSVHTQSQQRITKTHCNFTQAIDSMQAIDIQLRRFWEIEESPINRKVGDTLSIDERACEDHFVQTTERLPDGRFSVSIPFKNPPDMLGDSYTQAERRFLALEKRLHRNDNYRLMYSDFIHEYISLGHMSRVDYYGNPHFFMPHHGVFRENALTTKLRVVFDASALSSSGISLNDLQLVGPAVQGDLIAILMRFRENRYVACADVEKMYRQVMVDPKQRDLQLILWRDKPTDPLEVYQLNTVTYGTASAPFLSCRCLKQLAQECQNPEVSKAIRDSFYVDDFIHGDSDASKLIDICEKTSDVLISGGFPLRKWIFNFEHTFATGAECEFKELSLGENMHHKTLGIGWLNKQDQLCYHTKGIDEHETITKRIILSSASQIFDPLGLLSPVIMNAKALIQKLWLLKLDWDELVPNDIAQTWNRFIRDLGFLKDIRITRHVMCYIPIRKELHIFTDASQIAYGACAYIRTIDNETAVTVRLLCSKGKVASIKPVTIPRLELCGALVGARLYLKIITSLRSQFDSITFWTDSTIVLGWLRMPPNLLKTFVQNRIAEIHELTKDTLWHHVSGKENPADLVSRGHSLEGLHNCSLWWEGPRFLHDPQFKCTDMKPDPILDNAHLPEIKTCEDQILLAHNVDDGNMLFPFSRFSRFSRLRRACAYVLRFIHNARNKKDRFMGALSSEELRKAERMLAKLSQLESFPDVHECLRGGGTLKTRHNLLKLNPFMDDQQLIRVGGRIKNSPEFNFDKKHPILISSKHHFTLLLFQHEHKQLMHAGPQLVLFHIRETWWPVGGRNVSRRVVQNCVICTRMRGSTLTPIMGNLPKERLDPGFPFVRCGVDYAGPVLILNRKGRGAKTEKAYICIFICFATRAVHLELVSDLSSDAYLLALKRFISRRGKPLEIYSDNGKNFVGLMNEFSKFLSNCSNDIKDYATQQNIVFKMIPPYASHFGGLWEAGVKSCKHHLRRVIGNAHLTVEEFGTVLAQVEAVLNSRPLTPLSSDPKDFLPLTPAHFLVGRSLTAPVSADLVDVPENRLTRYQRVEQIRQHFWARWSKEFVSELQTRSKWKENTEDLKPDVLVLIKEDNFPPLKWNLGRIVTTYPGKDGVSRVADIRTATGITRRAFSKICPLPVEV